MKWFERTLLWAAAAVSCVVLTGCGFSGSGRGEADSGCTILLKAFQSVNHNREVRFYRTRLAGMEQHGNDERIIRRR